MRLARRSWSTGPLVVAALLIAPLAGGIDRAGGAFPGRDGLIAFSRTLENKKGGFADRIVTVRKNGRGLDAITPRCCKLAEEPSWSPNGKRIAFARDRYIFTMNRKGRKRDRLTKGKRYNGKKFEDNGPSWSPDAEQIVFSRRHPVSLRADLFVIDSDGSNLRPIETEGLEEFDPVWSPDGEWIAFMALSFASRPEGIYRMRPDGSEMQLVLELKDLRRGLDWSPDGELLAFSTKEAGGRPQIHTVRPDGTGDSTLTSERKAAFDPAFSPTGKRIAFTVRGVLKLIDAGRGKVKRLLGKTRGIGDFAPSWQPK